MTKEYNQKMRTSSTFNATNIKDVGDYEQWGNGMTKGNKKLLQRGDEVIDVEAHNQRILNERGLC